MDSLKEILIFLAAVLTTGGATGLTSWWEKRKGRASYEELLKKIDNLSAEILLVRTANQALQSDYDRDTRALAGLQIKVNDLDSRTLKMSVGIESIAREVQNLYQELGPGLSAKLQNLIEVTVDAAISANLREYGSTSALKGKQGKL